MTRAVIPNLRKVSQQGAALVVGLLLLLVLTLLAVSGMNTASLELIMAGNTQYYQNAFQAAETGIERAYAGGVFNPALTQNIPAIVPPEEGETEPTSSPGEAITGTSTDFFTATITPQLNGAALPALWGSSWDSFSTFHFEIESRGTSARNATAVNRQGVAVIAPHDPTVMPMDAASPALTADPIADPAPADPAP